jgi:hypothetical protein
MDARVTQSSPWTRDLARDLFPGGATPFGWTVLHEPAEIAMRRAWAALGAADPPPGAFWRLADDGQVYLNTDLLATAARALSGAAWIGPVRGESPTGFPARLRAQGAVRRAEAEIQAAATGAATLQTHLLVWLKWIRGLRWAQADLLQVMEELEPQAQAALQGYFTVRAGLEAAGWRAATRLPADDHSLLDDLVAGWQALPSVETARAVISGDEGALLTRFAHRGPGEMSAAARRWPDRRDELPELAARPLLHTPEGADARRLAAEGRARARLGGRWDECEQMVRRVRELSRAADVAWENVTLVMAAAQTWSTAAAAEAASAGLIAHPGDVLFLELEELKQIATGEWHGGYGEDVRAEAARRKAAAQVDTIAAPLPPPGATVRAEVADAGCAPWWPSAAGLSVQAYEPWSPGAIAARALGIPVVSA